MQNGQNSPGMHDNEVTLNVDGEGDAPRAGAFVWHWARFLLLLYHGESLERGRICLDLETSWGSANIQKIENLFSMNAWLCTIEKSSYVNVHVFVHCWCSHLLTLMTYLSNVSRTILYRNLIKIAADCSKTGFFSSNLPNIMTQVNNTKPTFKFYEAFTKSTS